MDEYNKNIEEDERYIEEVMNMFARPTAKRVEAAEVLSLDLEPSEISLHYFDSFSSYNLNNNRNQYVNNQKLSRKEESPRIADNQNLSSNTDMQLNCKLPRNDNHTCNNSNGMLNVEVSCIPELHVLEETPVSKNLHNIANEQIEIPYQNPSYSYSNKVLVEQNPPVGGVINNTNNVNNNQQNTNNKVYETIDLTDDTSLSNTSNSEIKKRSRSSWSYKEDRHLLNIVRRFTLKNVIYWESVMRKYEYDRTKNELKERYKMLQDLDENQDKIPLAQILKTKFFK